MTKPVPGYMPQLDALRTIAVLLVVVYHWFPAGEGFNWLPNGAIGVVIFFVISGFLITRILLENRNRILAGKAQLGHTYRNFFIRRALRIFPLYYVAITFVLIGFPETSDIDQHPFYYYLYGYNILLNKTGNWADVLSPFWTLGVEEQLYLIWPWVVLLLPKNSFRWALVSMIILGVLFRGYEYWQGNIDGVLTPASLDTFGMGALWAYTVTERSETIGRFIHKLTIAAGIALVVFIALLLLPGNHLLPVLFQRFVIAIMALYIIVHASMGIHGWAGKLLNNKALQYIGRISYGMYVFHMLVPGFIVPFVFELFQRFTKISFEIGYWSHRCVSFVALLLVASASWYFFEKPINDLKRYFSYTDSGQSSASRSVSSFKR